MTKLDENLSEIFDVTPLKEEVKTEVATTQEIVPAVIQQQIDPDDADMEEDFEELRQNTKDLLTKGKVALECALDIVQQSDQPRAIEVFSTLLGQMSRLNQEVMDLHEKRRKIKNTKNEKSGPSEETNITNNNAIFVGSTTELNKILTGLTGKKKDAA
jgi:hypothetical protein